MWPRLCGTEEVENRGLILASQVKIPSAAARWLRKAIIVFGVPGSDNGN